VTVPDFYMQPVITIRFVDSGGFITAGINWVTNSLWPHVEFGTPQGTWIGAHNPGGWRERPADYCVPKREAIYDIPCTQGMQDAHLQRIRAKIGTQYNRLDILGLLLRNRKLTNPHAVICSQGVTNEALILWGPQRFLNVLPGYSYLVTPEMVHLSPILVGHKRKI
jgi:hypothetical protein